MWEMEEGKICAEPEHDVYELVAAGKIILENGSRVWVWDPFVFHGRPRAGKVVGCNFNLQKVAFEQARVEYLVEFEKGKRIWVGSFQIVGWLTLVD